MDTFVVVGAVLIAVLGLTVHEAAHAWTADRLGDPTARMLGRVTLNPIPHVDPFLTILLPAMLVLMGSSFIFGGAKPVPVNLANFRRPWRDNGLVAIAGPASNLLQAALWAGLLSLLLHTGIWSAESSGVTILQLGVLINVLLFVFNMMPIPPLDGSRVVAAMLSPETRRAYLSIEPIGIFLVLGLILLVPGFHYVIQYALFYIGTFLADLTRLPITWLPNLGS